MKVWQLANETGKIIAWARSREEIQNARNEKLGGPRKGTPANVDIPTDKEGLVNWLNSNAVSK